MKRTNRREFLARSKKLGFTAAGLTVLKTARSVRAAPANEKVILGIVGIRGRGHLLAMGFALRGDCEIAYGKQKRAGYSKRVRGAMSAGNGLDSRPCQRSGLRVLVESAQRLQYGVVGGKLFRSHVGRLHHLHPFLFDIVYIPALGELDQRFRLHHLTAPLPCMVPSA